MSVESRMPGKVVLVSNLPLETTYRTLTAIFGLYGTITACTVTVQLPPNGAQATVEYSAASSAVAAVENQVSHHLEPIFVSILIPYRTANLIPSLETASCV